MVLLVLHYLLVRLVLEVQKAPQVPVLLNYQLDQVIQLLQLHPVVLGVLVNLKDLQLPIGL